MGNNIFTLASFFYSVLLTITYFSKKRIGSYENKLYEKIICLNIASAVFALATYYTIMYSAPYFLISICSKGLLLVYFMWLSQLTKYVYVLMHPIDKTKDVKKEFKNMRTVMHMCMSIFIVGIIVLPIEYSFDGKNIFTYGMSANMTYIGAAIYWVLWMFFIIKNINKLINKKGLIPIIIIMICMPLVLALQKTNPTLLLTTFLEGFATMVMYFTIENPDLQMLREFHKAREYADNLNAEKSEFLFNMASEIKTPIGTINRISKDILMQDDINVIKEKVNEIKYSSSNLLELVDKVLDINSIEKRKVSVRESKYNTTNLFKGIISQTELKLKNSLVEFRINYDKSIPEELYGDAVRLRQIINTIIGNSIKYTKQGFIELGINSIVKHDLCRLIITIEDSGIGMKSEVVEHLFDKDLNKIDEIDNPKMNLGLVKTLLDLIGGTIMVNSELNQGTKFTIILDQRIENSKRNKTIEAVEKYEEMYLNNKRVMLVINDEKLSKKVSNLFKKYSFEVETVSLGQHCLEKIRNNERFDLIIMEDNLPKLSSENTLIKLKDIQGFKTPAILLTKCNDINEKEEYLKLGFNEAITLPLKKESIEELVKTYELEN